MATVKRHSHYAKKFVRFTFNYNDTDSSGTAFSAVGSHGSGIYIPSGAYVDKASIRVNTTFTSPTADAASIAVGLNTTVDLVAATTIADTRNIWDAGNKGTLVTAPNLGADAAHDSAVEVIDLFGALPVLTTAERELMITVAVEALTAGKATIYLEYWLP